MEFINFVVEKAFILIPVLIIIGAILKATPNIPNWSIPYILLGCGILGAVGIIGVSVEAVLQGVLVTGVAVFGYEAFKSFTEAFKGERGAGIDYNNTIGKRLADFSQRAYTHNGGIIAQCVWYVRGRGIEKLGVNTGIMGNADTWYNQAKKKGLKTGTALKPNCIVCFNYGQFGHVLFVESIEGQTVYYTEANTPMDNRLSEDDGQLKKTTVAEMTARQGYQGCIYLVEDVPDINVGNIPELFIGDRVKVKLGAKYANGVVPSAWVYNGIFYVRSISSNMVTISTDTTNPQMTGVVYTYDLIKVGHEAAPTIQPPVTPPVPVAPPIIYLTVSTLFSTLWLCGGWNGSKPTNNIVKMPKGSRVELIEKSNGSWYKVKYDGRTGYASAQYLK